MAFDLYATGQGDCGVRHAGGPVWTTLREPDAPYGPPKPYDGQTRSLLETDQKAAGIDSNDKNLKPNPDGSYTVWFGPKAPKGKEGNWVQTVPGRSYFVFARLYGPLERATLPLMRAVRCRGFDSRAVTARST